MIKIDGLAGDQIRGSDGERNPQLFKRADVQISLGVKLQPLIRGQAQPGESPLPEIAKAQRSRAIYHFLEGQSARIRHSRQRPRAGARNVVDGDAVLLQSTQHPGVCDPSGEAAA